MTQDELLQLARSAAHKAYAPYSRFRVGCAVESVDGEVVTGANMENACYRLGVCAEQSALTAAQHAFGLDRVARLAVVGGTGPIVCTPCGGCRQAILEAAQLSGRRRRDPVRQRRRQRGRALHHRRADPARLRSGEPRRVGTGLGEPRGQRVEYRLVHRSANSIPAQKPSTQQTMPSIGSSRSNLTHTRSSSCGRSTNSSRQPSGEASNTRTR